MKVPAEVLARAAAIKLAAFDVDGVFTDGGLILGPNGQEFKQFHVHDGHGLVMLRKAGIRLAIITGRESEVVAERMAALGVDDIYQGQSEKVSAYESILNKYALADSDVSYKGDDLPDVPLLQRAGLAASVPGARIEAREQADWVAPTEAGHGAVRDFCELLLFARESRS